MGMSAGGGSSSTNISGKTEKIKALVVEDVHILTKEVEVQVPKYIEKIVEVPKYVTKDITVHNVKVVEDTVRTQNVEVEEKVIVVERPTFRDVEVERPVYKNVEVTNYTIKKIDFPVEVPRITEKLVVKEIPIEVKKYTLVEEIIKVPKIQYVPTEIERVVWKDVPRERCSHCGKEI